MRTPALRLTVWWAMRWAMRWSRANARQAALAAARGAGGALEGGEQLVRPSRGTQGVAHFEPLALV